MKRWLVALLVLLAVIILISPGVVGRIAEKNLEENIEWAATEASGVEFRKERFDRGWFASEGRHRLVLTHPSARKAAAEYRDKHGYAELPSLIIDTRLDHGLLPVSSLGRNRGTLAPGLASAVSTFHIDPGNGELTPLPGALYSNVALDGSSRSRYLLETGVTEIDDTTIQWQGADVVFETDWSRGVFNAHGRIEPINISNDVDTLRIGAMSIAADQTRSDYGFNVGTAAFDIESMTVESANAPVTIGKMAFASDAAIENERVNIGTRINIDEIAVASMGEMSFAMDMGLRRLDARSVQVVVAAFREAHAAPDPELALAELFPRIEDDLQKIVAAGVEFRIDRLDVTLPQGKVSTKMTIEIPEGDAGADFSWGAVLLAMTATADVRMPAELFEFARLMSPQAEALVTMGLLQQDGNEYVMNAEYAQGLLNVNGAPMPIPIPGM